MQSDGVEAVFGAFEEAARRVAPQPLFELSAYKDLRRTQAIVLRSLARRPLFDLVIQLAAVWQAFGRPSFRQLRAAAVRFLQLAPCQNISKKFTAEAFATYVARQLNVIFAHITRLLHNATKQQNAFKAAPEDCHENGRAILGAYGFLAAAAARVQGCKRKLHAAASSSSWPDVEAIDVPVFAAQPEDEVEEPGCLEGEYMEEDGEEEEEEGEQQQGVQDTDEADEGEEEEEEAGSSQAEEQMGQKTHARAWTLLDRARLRL